MATPANPLDVFSTYTYHFELHASNNWDELAELADYDSNLATTPRDGIGTLLINTRKDAHQSIESVRYRQMGNGVDAGATMQAFGELDMEIIEPSNILFVEKLKNQATKYDCTGYQNGMYFALKIIFVGRMPDNTIITKPLPYIIPLMITGLDAKFTYKGGEYAVKFVISAFAAGKSANAPDTPLATSVGYSNNTITIKANTVSEALSQLEDKLNANYKRTYERDIVNNVGARPLKYRILNNLGIDGNLDTVGVDSFAPGAPRRIPFHPDIDIVSMARNIVYSSKDICAKIAESKTALKNDLHSGVQIPSFTSSYLLHSDRAEIVIDVHMYKGGGKVYEFDFLFSDPGKNVDVMDFDVRFPTMVNAMLLGAFGLTLNSNSLSKIPTTNPQFYKNVTTKDVSQASLVENNRTQAVLEARSGDVGPLNSTPASERRGHAGIDSEALDARRGAIDAVSAFVAAAGIQLSFTIRGHFDIISDCIAYPDGTKAAVGTTTGLWVKVNIKDQEGQPFYYQGYYQVFTIDNIFSGGKFTQILTVMMSPNSSPQVT